MQNDIASDKRRSAFKRLVRPIVGSASRSQENTDEQQSADERPSSHKLIDGFSLTEKIIFSICVLLLLGSVGFLFWKMNEGISVLQPIAGGSFTEGVVGSPRFINPVLAVSDADQDLVSLVYSGLLKRLPNKELAYDLAESITVSNDATVYTVTIREDAVFHDGAPVTARDVAFTVTQVQDPQLRSPVHGDWSGVNVTIVDEREVQFELDEPYAPFLENLTLGILPAHIWSPLSATQFPSSPHNDITPIGSGPYKVASYFRQEETSLSNYTLTAFENYTLGTPYISTITVRSFTDERTRLDALKSGSIDGAGGISTDNARELEQDGKQVETAYLPRIFGVFFNHNENDVFTSDVFRSALSQAIDKEQLVADILNGYGAPINSPVPKGFLADTMTPSATTSATASSSRQLLAAAGYSFRDGILVDEDGKQVSFTLSTADTPELIDTANMLKEARGQLGMDITVKIFPTSDLNRDVIRQRSYEALLFGEVIGVAGDFFPFWHSSQQEDPGLNIAQYANIDVDTILEEMRETANHDELNELYQKFVTLIQQDNPALFLYTPSYIYAAPRHVESLEIGPVNTAHNRFSLIHQWYIDTKRVWTPFATNTDSRVPRQIKHDL